jgi:predicted permease
LDAIVAILPLELPANTFATVNGVVIALTAATSIATALVFGVIPAWRLSRTTLTGISAGTRAGGLGLSRKTGQLLVAAEVALAVVLLAGAGLLLRSFDRLLSVDLGFDPGRVVFIRAAPVERAPGNSQAFYPGFIDALRKTPGVEAVGAIDFIPLRRSSVTTSAQSPDAAIEEVATQNVLPGYFETMGIPLRAGRVFTANDPNPRGLILDEAAAARLFPDGDAIGRTVGMRSRGMDSAEVVGVVANVKHWGAQVEADLPNIYGLVNLDHAPSMHVVFRPAAGGPPPDSAIRDIAAAIGPPVLVELIQPGEALLSTNLAVQRHRTVLLSLLGGLGLLLTLVGIASVTAFAVSHRTQEIGVRMAFGADARSVVWTMMRDAVWPVGLGLLAGLGAASYATTLVASFLFETTPTDPMTFAAVAALLAVAATCAAWLPARAAARVDPVQALRAE